MYVYYKAFPRLGRCKYQISVFMSTSLTSELRWNVHSGVLWFDVLILLFCTCFQYITCTKLWCYVPCNVVSVSEAMHTAVRQPADVPTNLWWGKLTRTCCSTGGSHRYTIRSFHLLQLQYFDHLLLTLCPCMTCFPPNSRTVVWLRCCAFFELWKQILVVICSRVIGTWKCLWHCACPRAADVTAVKCHTLIAGPSSIFLFLFYLSWKNVITLSIFCSECVVCGCHVE